MAEQPKAIRWNCCCCGNEYAISTLRHGLCPTCKRKEDAARRIVTEKPEEAFPLRETLERVRKIVREQNVQFPTWEELAAMRARDEREFAAALTARELETLDHVTDWLEKAGQKGNAAYFRARARRIREASAREERE